MVNIALASDLHIELSRSRVPIPDFHPDTDIIILAGDITNSGKKTRNGFERTFEALRERYQQPILYIPGNHEYYGSMLEHQDDIVADLGRKYDIQLLQKRYTDYQDIRFFGCTLWSHFLLNGSEELPWAIRAAERSLADYRAIQYKNGLIKARHTKELFEEHFAWLSDAVRQCPSNIKKVICTHFAPHPVCTAPEYQGDELSPYFINNLDDFIAETKPSAWLFGHTHYNIDTNVHESRLVSNQLGYLRETTHFEPQKLITL